MSNEILELGGSATNYSVGDIKPIYSDEQLITETRGHQWLRTGIVNDDVSNYPNAKSIEHEGVIVVGIPQQLFFQGTSIPLFVRIK